MYEDAYSFIYNENAANTVDGVPEDTNVYLGGDAVDSSNDYLLDEANATAA